MVFARARDSPPGIAPTAPAGRRSWWPYCPNIILPPFLSPLRHPVTASQSLSHALWLTPSRNSLSLLLFRIVRPSRSDDSRIRGIRCDTMRRATCVGTQRSMGNVRSGMIGRFSHSDAFARDDDTDRETTARPLSAFLLEFLCG